MRGYSADRDADVRSRWTSQSAEWLSSGEISFPYTLIDGLEQAPKALEEAAEGRHFGTVLVKP